MRTILALTVLASMALAMTPGFSTCQVTDFGTPVSALKAASWSDIEKADLTSKICMAATWGGTATVFALIPWRDKPWAETTMKIAASVAVAGLFGGLLLIH
jgi:hypothetical protein